MPHIPIHLKKTEDDSYNIVIESGIAEKLPEFLTHGKKYAIITDFNVEKLYGKKLAQICREKNITIDRIILPSGEKTKTLQTIERIAESLLKKGFDRGSMLIALGGGVIGDITGFTAACFMRGIPFIQIPTTLLAMVDASIGGKTGVNMPSGKNMIGAFYQPKQVIIDPKFLQTLSDNEYRNGLAEIVKHAVIFDAEFFNFLENNVKKILNRDLSTLNKIIIQSCKIKVKIVEKDEKEKNVRILLNYGHTFGHALEQMFHYKISHGLCVAEGMKIINKLAVEKKCMNATDTKRIEELLTALGFSEKFPKYSLIDLQKNIQRDKKFRNGKNIFIIATKIGTSSTLSDSLSP
ncbi:3-dehydroquinate synthase [Candidatus Peregrinibacteria bacterium]|nr:3-dehydroquinate synthase [Candidatus Peregrinibacteria bacterium]